MSRDIIFLKKTNKWEFMLVSYDEILHPLWGIRLDYIAHYPTKLNPFIFMNKPIVKKL